MASFEFYKLKNGVQVALVPMLGVKSVAIGVYAKVGSRYETENERGLSHFLEHLAFKGTKNYPTHVETSSLEAVGAMQNAWTSVDATSYYCKIPANEFTKGLNLVADLALNPTIPEAELQTEKTVIIEEIHMRYDQPDHLVWEEFQKQMFANHPLQYPISGEEEVIKSATRTQIVDYHDKHYYSENLFVVIAGDIPRNAKTAIEKLFDHLPQQKSLPPQTFEKKSHSKIHVVSRPKDNQVNMILGGYGSTSFDTDRYIQNILLTILGTGMSSRLHIELREKRGLCYSVFASDDKYPDTGTWSVFAGVSVEKLNEAILAIKDQLKLLIDQPVSELELQSAKQRILGATIFSQENPLKQMEFYASQIIDRGSEIYDYDQNLASHMAVTAKQVQTYAAKLFTDDNLYLTVLGPVTSDMLK